MNRAIAAALRPLPDAADAASLAARDAELSFPDWGMDAGEAARLFESHWAAARASSPGKTPSLPRVLWRAFRAQFLYAAALKLAWGALVLTGVTYFVRVLLAYIRFRATDHDHTPEEAAIGIGHACGFLVCMLLQSLSMQQMSIVSTRLGLRVEAAVSSAVYRKSLVYDRFATGPVDVVSLISKDCSKLGEACTTLQYLWSGALEAVAIMGILLALVGRAALPGLGVVLLLVPAQFFVGVATAAARKRAIAAADKRVRLTDEVLRSIKLVKMYAHEDKFAAGVAAERHHEDSIANSGGILKAINYALVFAMPPVIALSIFGVQTLDSTLEAGLAFTTLSLFNTLRLPLVLLPKGLRASVEASASAGRICAFLLAAERSGCEAPSASAESDSSSAKPGASGASMGEATSSNHIVISTKDGAASSPSKNGTIEISDVDFAYGASAPLLRSISLSLKAGSLTAIAGTVGSGKSTLLAAVLGHMTAVRGQVSVIGSFAYVPQTPWCAHGTVRDNILFGKAWDERRYRDVIFACALERDMTLLADGDLTEIGERGMNLSGGQRQRIAIARAVYARSDIVLLDSPLSAVDAYTSQHIFRHAVSGMLKSEGATVLLVTHQVALLPMADTLVIMREGTTAYVGAPSPSTIKQFFPGDSSEEEHVDDILLSALDSKPAPQEAAGDVGQGQADRARRDRSGTEFNSPRAAADLPRSMLQRTMSVRADVLRTMSVAAAADEHVTGGRGVRADTERQRSDTGSSSPRADVVRSMRSLPKASKATVSTIRSAASALAELPLALPGSPEFAAIAARRIAARITAGRSSSGASGGTNSYLVMLHEIRWFIFFPVLAVFVVTQLVRIYSDIWISVWVTRSQQREESWYLSVYSGYVAAFAIMLVLRGYFFYSSFVAAATRLHNKMFAALLRAPMSFFTLTPLGSVLSSVSRDMDLITEYLLEDVYMVLVYIMILGTTIGVVVRQVTVFAAVAAVLLVLSAIVYARYLAASTVLKARAGAAATAIAAHSAETMQGAAVVQAFRAEERYAALNAAKLLEFQQSQFTLATLNLWLTVRQDLIGCLMVFATCIMAVALETRLSPAAAGLAVSNSFQILLFLSLMVRTAASAHDAMGAVDRVHALGELAPEPDIPAEKAPRLPPTWPSGGEVEFQNVVMSYLPASPHVLKGVTFRCHAGEKIGIVGRTGAGKSSLIMALFRLAPPGVGAVRIDGVDVSQLALKDLRQRIAIIPQEPVMFEGTLRSNLDPFAERTDAELLEALERCLLRDTVAGHPDGLLQPVESMGANFSLGQQQLVCLARALLNKSRLLLLDEATAALDAETDAMVQRVVRSAFADRTVMTIAHRLDTIIDSDRILVMDAGRVAEFDSPAALLRDENSIFASLCRQSGAGSFAVLRAAAERHEQVLSRLHDEVVLAEQDRLEARGGGPAV